MRLLADENCDFALVRALRNAGHDIIAISEIAPRINDQKVIELCLQDKRILLTEDKDFGQLVFASGFVTIGVVLLRFPVKNRADMVSTVVEFINQRGEQLSGCFSVVKPGLIRIGRLPDSNLKLSP